MNGSGNALAKRWAAFISHSSDHKDMARQIEADLEADGQAAWLDDSEMTAGMLLTNALQSSIRNSRVFLLLWSRAAEKSRWVIGEILTAFHLGRFIVPCVVDGTELPYFLQKALWIDLKAADESALKRLRRAVREAPDTANKLPLQVKGRDPHVQNAIDELTGAQKAVTDCLQARDRINAREKQDAAEARLKKEIVTPSRFDPMIINLAGYHSKNEYILRHWDLITAGRTPNDPLLEESERYFFETLMIEPNDVSALNGVGSVLIYRREFDAAEFFIETSIVQAKRQGIYNYEAAEHDRAMIQYYRNAANQLG